MSKIYFIAIVKLHLGLYYKRIESFQYNQKTYLILNITKSIDGILSDGFLSGIFSFIGICFHANHMPYT